MQGPTALSGISPVSRVQPPGSPGVLAEALALGVDGFGFGPSLWPWGATCPGLMTTPPELAETLRKSPVTACPGPAPRARGPAFQGCVDVCVQGGTRLSTEPFRRFTKLLGILTSKCLEENTAS